MTGRTTVRLPDELILQAKRKAAAEGRTFTALMEEGLRHVVAETPDAARPPRVTPPLSKAKGGFAPGITDFRDIAELEDLEYVERLRRL